MGGKVRFRRKLLIEAKTESLQFDMMEIRTSENSEKQSDRHENIGVNRR